MLTSLVGLAMSELDTPALLIDLDAFERNIAAMAADIAARNCNWRPHTKVHYRSKQEIEEYRKTKDPIQVFQHELLNEGVLDDALIEKIDAEARAEADNAAEFAEVSPFPTADDIQKDVYWETDNPSERKSQGRLFFD